MKVSSENDNNFGYEKITILKDNMPVTLTQIIVHFMLITFNKGFKIKAKQNMNSLINVSEKFKFFQEIHKSGERPPYIDICKLKSDRSFLSKFRLSAHSIL